LIKLINCVINSNEIKLNLLLGKRISGRMFVRLEVDASQGAEEMLEHLTDKVLHQEEQIQQLEEEKNDLVSDARQYLSIMNLDAFLLVIHADSCGLYAVTMF